MRQEILYNENKHQAEYHADLEHTFLHLSGGFGSGKSHGLVMKMIQLSWLNRPYPGGLMCPTFQDFKKDIKPIFEQIADENRIRIPFHNTDHYFRFPWTKGKLWVVSAENSLRGPNWAYAGVNEVTLIKMLRYREAIGRVRIKRAPHPIIASCGTPEGIDSEYYEFFVEKPPGSARIIFGDTRDNLANISKGYIDMLESSFDKIMLDAYLKGMFINMVGNRFYYNYDPNKHDDPNMVEQKDTPIYFSLDFNVSPMVGTAWQPFDWGYGAVDEIVIEDDATTDKMCHAMKARGFTPSRTAIFPDPAGVARSTKGQPDIRILEKNGFTDIRKRSQAPPIRQRQLNVNNVLEKVMIKLNPSKCPYLKKDLMGVQLDSATLEKVKTNKKMTHSSDGMDYLCDLLFEFSGRKPETRNFKLR